MLTLTVAGDEYFDEESGKFLTVGDITLQLEHSLVTISQWESVYQKAFLTENAKTNEEMLAYVMMMIKTPNVPADILEKFSQKNYNDISDYISDPQSATKLGEDATKKGSSRDVTTSELIYYWMGAFSIPFEAQHWHLNRLMTLIKIHSAKQEKPKNKKLTGDDLSRRRELNRQRKAAQGDRG